MFLCVDDGGANGTRTRDLFRVTTNRKRALFMPHCVRRQLSYGDKNDGGTDAMLLELMKVDLRSVCGRLTAAMT